MALKFSKFLFLLAPVAFTLLVGCHCVEVSERYGDRIDKIADKQLVLDRFYRPGLDLTRICHDCKSEDAVCHRPVMYPDSRIPEQAPIEPTLPAVPPAEQLEEPSLIPPVPPSSQPLETTSNTEAWQQSKRIVSAVSRVGSSPFMYPMSERKQRVSESVGVELTTAKEPVEWKPTVEIPALPRKIEPPSPLPMAQPETAKELTPRSVEAISAPAGVPPSQQFYRSLKAQE